jgi:hypothetical protein
MFFLCKILHNCKNKLKIATHTKVNVLRKIVKNRGLGLGLQNLKDLFGLQVTK